MNLRLTFLIIINQLHFGLLTSDQYGFINTCLKSLVIDHFGEDTWNKLRSDVVDGSFALHAIPGVPLTAQPAGAGGKAYVPDIAPHDATRHLILLNQQRLAEIELSSQLECKKEQLRQLSQHLEQEKQKTENLLYAMLPKHVANQLKEGKRVEAGEFKECTILFSDVVTFTNICSWCEPIQIVNMLNSMYLKFDRLTTVHNVYK
ncbi:guanylate cyclase soluble subunit beta-2-like isoform X1, partial [Tachysurus ichikawai]